MSNHITPTDVLGPTVTTGGGVAAATATLSVIQWIGLIASIVGIVWGTINIIKAMYFFALWINKTALPWYRSKYQNKSK